MKNGNEASLVGYTDYYPFGMAMPGRNLVGDYRYGYQGQFAEEDGETGKNAFNLRLYDPRINRWLSPDPARQYASPYLGMGNNWINAIDPDGGYVIIIGGDPTIKRYLNRLMSTAIGREVLKEYINNPHKHLHIGFGPSYNSEGEKINAITLAGLSPNTTGERYLLSHRNFDNTFNQFFAPYLFDASDLKGDNRYILLANNRNSEERKIQSLFHEITAHNLIPDLLNGDRGLLIDHLRFSQHPKGHEIPDDIGASILTHFLEQFRNQFQLFNNMNFTTTPDNFGGEKIMNPRFF